MTFDKTHYISSLRNKITPNTIYSFTMLIHARTNGIDFILRALLKKLSRATRYSVKVERSSNTRLPRLINYYTYITNSNTIVIP